MNRIVASSQNYAQSSRVLKRYRHKLAIIPFGIDPVTYPPVEKARMDTWSEKLGRDFFLFVGVLRYYKGLHILLEAMQNAPYRAVIVGAGPIEQELKAKAQALGLSNIHFLGFQSDQDKMALYALSRGVIFPSNQRSEAFGITLLEALMAGRPMITSEIGTGTSFVNVHQKTGLVVQPNHPEQLRQAMDTLFYRPDLSQAMGLRARNRFEQQFTADRMGQTYIALYTQIAKEGKHAYAS
jgi:rhamnosyl/mannosyltransferase